MAGIVAGVERGGGRSSGIDGVGAAGLREASEVVLRAPGGSVSTVTRSKNGQRRLWPRRRRAVAAAGAAELGAVAVVHKKANGEEGEGRRLTGNP